METESDEIKKLANDLGELQQQLEINNQQKPNIKVGTEGFYAEQALGKVAATEQVKIEDDIELVAKEVDYDLRIRRLKSELRSWDFKPAILSNENALFLIEAGEGKEVTYHLDQFQGLDHQEIANKLIEAGETKLLAEYLGKFEGLDSTTANKLIEAGEIKSVGKWLTRFEGLDHKEIANKLFEAGEFTSLAYNLDQFQGLDHKEIANKLFETGKGDAVAYNLDQFQGLDHKEIANKLIEAGKGDAVTYNLYKFQGLDSTTANKLIEAGVGQEVAYNLHKFQGLDHKEIANKLMETGKIKSLAERIYKFKGLDHKEIANKLFEAGEFKSLAYNIYYLEGVDHKEIANKLMEAGAFTSLADNLDRFEGLDHKEIANKLMEAGAFTSLADNLDRFEGLDHKEIANKLIEAGVGQEVAYNLHKFQGLDSTTANKLIEAGEAESVADDLDKFQGLDSTTANKLIEAGEGESVANRLDKFESLGDSCISYLIDSMKTTGTTPETIKNYLFKFVDISEANLAILRDKLNMPNLSEMPRPRIAENGEILQPPTQLLDRWYGDLSYTYMEGGFNKATIGRIIRLRIENNLAKDIHDASYWLNSFKIPDAAYNIEAIQKQHEDPNFATESIENYKNILKDNEAETKFFIQLLAADQQLRNRLTYEGTETKLTTRDWLDTIFEQDSSAKSEFNAYLGGQTSSFNENFYDKVLKNNPDIKIEYDQAIIEGVVRRKFFKDLFKSNSDISNLFNQEYKQMREKIERDFYNKIVSNRGELADSPVSPSRTYGNESWFFEPENQLLFNAAMSTTEAGKPLYKQTDFSLESLDDQARKMISSYNKTFAFGTDKTEYGHKLTDEELTEKLNQAIEKIKLKSLESPKVERIGETVEILSRARKSRQEYINDTQNWLTRHCTSPENRLMKVWTDRAMALAEGTTDNAKSIELWQSEFGFKRALMGMSKSGELQAKYNLSYDIVMSHENKPIRMELLRLLSSKDIIKAMSIMEKFKEVKSLIPEDSLKVEVNDREYRFDIIGKRDPRGFTIGIDTGCCMHLGGDASSCVKAGYKKPNCGFVAAYEDQTNKIVAQSFWYINKKSPNVIVMDNIEANEGRDLNNVAEIYRHALNSYITAHPELGIDTVHVGTGYTDINYSDMPKVDTVPSPKNIYSDAAHQRLLLRL